MTTPATSVVRYSRFFAMQHAGSVLDYGAGTLRNAVYLLDQGFKVFAADLHDQVKVLRSHPAAPRLAGLLEVKELEQSHLGVDLVISTYVFNIIMPKEKRLHYLENVVANLRPGGYFLMELISRQPEAGGGSPCDHYFNRDISVKIYTHQELTELLAPYGFEPLCHYYTSHAMAAIYRLSGEAPLRS